jgi:type II secretory pathway component PulJ
METTYLTSAGATLRYALATRRAGYTLVELLVATALTLLVMAGVVSLFGSVTDSISRGQAMMETAERLRATAHRLQQDLKYVTATMIPPLDPRAGLGYFEVVEGPGPHGITGAGMQPANSEGGGTDTTVGDVDDMLMFTTRSFGEPFLGRFGNQTHQSQVAEVAWFLRGTTLYRRMLLVVPGRTVPAMTGFYDEYDVSVRQEGGSSEQRAGSGPARLVTNSLGDLTNRQNRFAHQPYAWPHDVRFFGQLGLPTLRECSHPAWPLPLNNVNPEEVVLPTGTPPKPVQAADFWVQPHPWQEVDAETGTLLAYQGPRIAEDVILTNVLSFDVKVYDAQAPVFATSGTVVVPGDVGYRAAFARWRQGGPPPERAGAYVDLFYLRGMNVGNFASWFSGPGKGILGLLALAGDAAVYDTWSTHYEADGLDQGRLAGPDEGSDGLDNDNRGGVDDAGEQEAPPPYPVPLRGIQVKIRVYEHDSRQVREVTVVQDFLS